MKIRISTIAAIALFAFAPLSLSHAQAAKQAGATKSDTGKVAAPAKTKSASSKTKSDTKAAPTKTKSDTKAAPTKTKSDTKAAPTKTKSDTKAAPTKTKSDTKAKMASASDKDSKDATALCKDGTYSHAASHTGACSAHGGVDKFLK